MLVGYLYLPSALKEKKIVLIEKNSSVDEISEKLGSAKIISNVSFFKIIARLYSLYKPLKMGEYAFTAKISPLQVIRKLASGKSIIHRLTIFEGATVNEIIDKINDQQLLEGSITGNIPEGYLMPSTYFYSYGDKRQNIIEKMRQGMSATLDKLIPELSPKSPLKTRLDVLILASIIEKEAGNNAEKPIIASVFINRLNKKMKLQADPTVIYAITEGKYRLNRALTRVDLKINSPYNTYYVKGLPVGAISCPGEKAIKAAIKPAKTDYLYFVSSGMGGHNFSKTLRGHLKNVIIYKNLGK